MANIVPELPKIELESHEDRVSDEHKFLINWWVRTPELSVFMSIQIREGCPLGKCLREKEDEKQKNWGCQDGDNTQLGLIF